MSKKRARFVTFLRFAIPILITVLWLSFIYSNSLKNSVESGEQSGKVHEIVNDVAQNIGIQEPITEPQVRESAHFIEFAVLSMLLCCDLWAFGVISVRKKLYVSLLFLLATLPASALLAGIDELLQKFSEGRATDIADVLTDTSGALTALLIFAASFSLLVLINRLVKRRKNASIT